MMTMELAVTLFENIQTTQLTTLREDLVESAIRYARIRVDWLLADSERRQSMEDERTTAHNAFITTCDILARNMTNKGEDGTWREMLGQDRKNIGDFACCLHCILGLAAR